jgi:hypothetical protein
VTGPICEVDSGLIGQFQTAEEIADVKEGCENYRTVGGKRRKGGGE